MDNRKKVVEKIYIKHDEDVRLVDSRHGKLEYFTTMTYIHKYLKPGMKILEIGAGTGRYSIALAKEGYDITAVEYIKHNVSVLKKNAKGVKNISIYQGDSVDLSRFNSNSFDIVLNLGPMYHLYTEKDVNQAIDESIRVAKHNGVVMFAYLPVASFIFGCYMKGNLKFGLEENFDSSYNVIHYPEQNFTGYEIKVFENLFRDKGVKKLKSLTTDSILNAVEDNPNFVMTDEDFELFKKYHLATCEKLEMQGIANHMLYICKKIKTDN